MAERKAAAETSNVTVVVRVRPLNERERSRGAGSLVSMPSNGRDTILTRPQETDSGNARAVSRKVADSRTFSYDHSLYSTDPRAANYASQTDLFECLGRGFVDHALNGYNCCILAYGQTGAGKTHSMIGTSTEPGLIPLICDDIFGRIERSPRGTFNVSCSYYEIYNEVALDLLLPRDGTNAAPKPLKVRESPDTGPYLERLSEFGVSTARDVQAFMDVGNQYRRTASTKMNDTSSRSHAVFTLLIKHTATDDVTGMPVERTSRFRLVDLAGSERASATGATGDRLREGAKINRSLTTLGRVISKLADPKHQGVVPYRDSILTWLMSDSLGGNSKTAMLACVSPADYDETLSTLRYADAVKMISTRAVVNAKAGDQQVNGALDLQLRETLALLARARQEKAELQQYEVKARELRDMVESVTTSSRARISSLEREVDALRTHLRLALEALKNPFPDFSRREEEVDGDLAIDENDVYNDDLLDEISSSTNLSLISDADDDDDNNSDNDRVNNRRERKIVIASDRSTIELPRELQGVDGLVSLQEELLALSSEAALYTSLCKRTVV